MGSDAGRWELALNDHTGACTLLRSASMTGPNERGSSHRAEESGTVRWVLEPEPGEAFAPTDAAPANGVEYPDIPLRSIAFVIDLIIIQATAPPCSSRPVRRRRCLLSQQGIPDTLIGSWVGFGVPVLIVALLQALILAGLWRVYTASPGQLLTGLQTVRERDGRRLSRSASLVRWIFIFLPALMMAASTDLGVWWAFGIGAHSDQNGASGFAITLPVIWYGVLLLSAVIDKRGRGLHDRLSRSVVVRRVA